MASLLHLFLSLLGLSIRNQPIPPTYSPSTVSSSTCDLHVDGNGTVYCIDSYRCYIQCEGKLRGFYTCTPESGWNGTLPSCVREVGADVPVGSAQCGENEEYVTCVNHCNRCVKPPPGACSRRCAAGCDCKTGYTRNESSVCVPEEQCAGTARCPENERPSDCVVPCNDCHSRGDCKIPTCKKGCDCQEGYFRDHQEKCIPASECTKGKKINTFMGGCIDARCVAFCQGYGLKGGCKDAYKGGEKLCLCSK